MVLRDPANACVWEDVTLIHLPTSQTGRFQEKYEEADTLYLRSIEMTEATLGPNHPTLAARLNDRALLLVDQVTSKASHLPLTQSRAALPILFVTKSELTDSAVTAYAGQARRGRSPSTSRDCNRGEDSRTKQSRSCCLAQ